MTSDPVEIPFHQLVEALLDPDKPFPPRYLYRLSDLEPIDVQALEAVWQQVPDWRRQALLEDIEDLSEKDTLLSYEALSRFALSDRDPKVRSTAIRTLWEYASDDLVPIFIKMLDQDPSEDVRAALASALGRYVYLGEIEELPERILHQIEERLLQALQGSESRLVQRRALESLGFSSREEVPGLIKTAYNSKETDWKASALFAMGRSADEQYIPQVVALLEDDSAEIRLEAARAAGELEASRAVPRLVDLLNDDDDDVRMASVWSLSQIGGHGVRDVLEKMYETADGEEEADLIGAALDNLTFTEDMQAFSIIDIEDGDDGEDGDEDEFESAIIDEEELIEDLAGEYFDLEEDEIDDQDDEDYDE